MYGFPNMVTNISYLYLIVGLSAIPNTWYNDMSVIQ